MLAGLSRTYAERRRTRHTSLCSNVMTSRSTGIRSRGMSRPVAVLLVVCGALSAMVATGTAAPSHLEVTVQDGIVRCEFVTTRYYQHVTFRIDGQRVATDRDAPYTCGDPIGGLSEG